MRIKKLPNYWKRIIKCSITSIATLAFDIMFLFFLVEFIYFRYLYATALSFLTAHTIHYALDRKWSFKGTKTDRFESYFSFIMIGLLGIVIVLTSVKIFVEVLGLGYIVSRLLASIIAGIAIFILNYILTFKLGHELKEVKDLVPVKNFL